MKVIKAALQSILYAFLIVGFHLILIYFLEIRIEGWETELIKESIKVYFLPLLLCFINSLMIIRSRRVKYHVTWFLLSTIPSSLLLMFFKSIQDIGERERQFVSIELFPKYSLEMFSFLPGGLLVFQLLFTLYLLIKIRIETNR
ncbi:hypothetical protein PATY110618_11405 [Paenibacillus typhae]|uniref:Uncharacterized protein n=1 Tax=Paenibacillus typhae TaxID=1174501 RepID=A0A1G9HVD4_9BACL|nr:hypothetical protein SAMN05216192_1862 [Paenibacillus typhae]